MASAKLVNRPKLEEYKGKYKEHLKIERKNGIILLQMHTNGGAVKWSLEMHNALGQAFHEIGNDPENEVMILTSTGSTWLGPFDMESADKGESELSYDLFFYDTTKLIENLIFDVDIPTIGAVNGPGVHTEIGLMCDLTICAEEALFSDMHFVSGMVPGDGQLLAFQGLIGLKRANYATYMGQTIDAKTALEWGMVNEVLPSDKLMDRAWEIAETIMQQSRVTRRLTSQLLRRPWKRLLINDFQVHVAHELYHIHKELPKHTNAIFDKAVGKL